MPLSPTRTLVLLASLLAYAAAFAIICFAFILFFFWLVGALASPANAADVRCPATTPCRIITLTADEESALTGPNMILQSAEQGRFLDLSSAVKYFRDKIRSSPQGELPAAPPQESKPVDSK